MNNTVTEEFQKIWFNHVEVLIKNGMFVLEKENNNISRYELKVNPKVKNVAVASLSNIYFELKSKAKYKDFTNYEDEYQYLLKGMLNKYLHKETLDTSNVEANMLILSNYKKDFLEDKNPQLLMAPANIQRAKKEDSWRTVTEYMLADYRTTTILFNLTLPLINYFEKNNYECDEMFRVLNETGLHNMFPAVNREVGNYAKVEHESLLAKYTLAEIVDTNSVEFKTMFYEVDWNSYKSLKTENFVCDGNWNKMGSMQRREVFSLVNDIQKGAESYFENNYETETYNQTLGVIKLALNKSFIFNKLEKAFNLPLNELSDYRDSLLSDKNGMKFFNNSDLLEMNKNYQVGFSKIVQRHLEFVEAKELAMELKKKKFGM